MEVITTKSPVQTKKIGKALAMEIFKTPLSKKALILALKGELGSGKTTFLQGFAKGLGIKEKITSPTFIIMKKIQIPKSKFQMNSKIQIPKFENFYHFDCYRLEKPKEVLILGFKKIISSPQNIVAVEWSDKIKKILPKGTIWIKFKFIDKKTREIVIR